MSRCRLPATVLSALLIPIFQAAAQIPDAFENLQLLPKDINKGQLVGTMRGWATALGVRCTHCHVGPDNLVGMDFASDDKPTKRTARKMLEMGLEYYPRSALLNAVMAMAFTAAGEIEQAQSALDTALELDPENRMAGFAKQQLDEAKKH